MVSLNEVGTFIWERLENGAELAHVVAKVVEEFETTGDAARQDAEEFVRVLIDKEMLVPC